MIANFDKHAVFEKLQQLKDALALENGAQLIGPENFSFFQVAFSFISDGLKMVIPTLVNESDLTSIANEIEAATSQINAFAGNANPGHIQNAINNLNSAVTRIQTLPKPNISGDLNLASEILAFRDAVVGAYHEVESRAKGLEERINTLEKDLNEKTEEVIVLERLLVAKEGEFQKAYLAQKNEFDVVRLQNTNSLENDRKRYSESLEEQSGAFEMSVEKFINDNQGRFDKQSKQFEKSAVDVVRKLNERLNEASKIVNIVGNIGVTGNYQNIANQNGKSANFFRWLALGFMVIMSILLGWSIIDLSTGVFDVYKSLVRILAAAVLTYPAIYAARESSKHRKLETENRNLELELASIGPFIELLPEAKKELIKEELVKKYFGNQSAKSNASEEEDVSISVVERLLKAVLPLLKKGG